MDSKAIEVIVYLEKIIELIRDERFIIEKGEIKYTPFLEGDVDRGNFSIDFTISSSSSIPNLFNFFEIGERWVKTYLKE